MRKTSEMNNAIILSVIIPAYNVEKYIAECIDSILTQNIPLEIIVVNDGSDDTTGEIADRYGQKYSNITVVHQVHSGPSIARNKGLEIAKGKYIAFIDSDDWVAENCFTELCDNAVKYGADMLLGNMTYVYPDDHRASLFDIIPYELKNKTFTGPECFISLMKSGSYYPMACSFIYKRTFIEKNGLRFEPGIIHEDELWTQTAIWAAELAVLTDIDFYYYRKRDGSIMHTLDPEIRVNSVCRIADKIVNSIDKLDNKELRDWTYVNLARLYYQGFSELSKIKHSSFELPEHYLGKMHVASEKMLSSVKDRLTHTLRQSKLFVEEYLRWRDNPCDNIIKNLSYRELDNKRLILIYNNPEWHQDNWNNLTNLPGNYMITFDRKYIDKAFAVVFHLPTLFNDMPDELAKPDDQIWVGWYMECEENYPWMVSDESLDIFDVYMSYRENSDVVCQYYVGLKEDDMPRKINPGRKENKVCMLISSNVDQSERQKYLAELMQYTKVDSYGKLFNNSKMIDDMDRNSKMKLYSRYKFIIAFENAIGKDYVTEKFYDPLLAGTVPIYLGAPNITDFIPGDDCFIHVPDYASPEELADYIKKCYAEDDEYMKYHRWREKPFREDFVRKVSIQDTDPFIRLCNVMDAKYPQ